MEVKIFKKKNRTYFLLIGKVCTLNDYTEIQNLIRNNVKLTNKKIVIDLSKITFISSQGLGSLIALFNSLRGTDINFILFNPRGEIRQELEIAGINMVIPTAYTEKELEQIIKMKKKK